ncbi:MAG: endonuclease Q family protein [Nanoarchaeota archaeon]|nr:endonuclease Q family protein [Nanoarchaeota archaeon]
MKIFADTHLHGRFSRATSKELTIPNLEKYARLKGINLLGTGDIQHPGWYAECKKYLPKEKEGIYYTESGFPFILSTELSLIYTQGGKGRRVHIHLLLPSFEIVDKLVAYLLKNGRIDYDGRPIFKISCEQLTLDLKAMSDDIEVIPAHIWTPWFSMFGSKSGFDKIEDCFGSATKHIYALETGLSSDPPMNWRLSALDKYTLVSNSDLHSFWPWRIGREATIFDCNLLYGNILKALRTKEGYVGTIEVDPNYGKYHFDGHRNCNVCLHPKESLKNNNICPKCKRPLTVGVLQRVEELADRPEGFVPEGAGKFFKLLPLSEIISTVLNKGIMTKEVWKNYYEILKAGKDEMDILLNVDGDKLLGVTNPQMVDAILKNRLGKIEVKPGYDGEYGIPVLGNKKIHENTDSKPADIPPNKQKGLGEFF